MVKALIIGATGKQGGATARALLKAGHEVHAFMRNPDSEAAQALKAQGAVLFKGNTEDIDSIKAAAAGTSAVFWVSMISFTDMDEEVRGTRNIIAAAREAGTVQHLLYSTALMAGGIEALPLWDHSPFVKKYWENKTGGEAAVRGAGFECYTILRPAEFMSNFVNPTALFQYPDMVKTGVWRSAFPPGFVNPYVDPDDIGRVAAAAIASPEKFGGKEVDVVGQRVSVKDAVALLAAAAGKKLRVEPYGREEALRLSEQNPVLLGQLLRIQNVELDPERNARPLDDFGLGFKSLEDYFNENKALVAETYKDVE